MIIDEFTKTLELKTLTCVNCFLLLVQYAQDKNGTQLYQDYKPMGVRYFGNAFQIDGKTVQGTLIGCPRCRYPNFIKDTDECIAEQIRLQYNYGKICEYHHRKGTKCDRRQECEGDSKIKPCVVKINYGKAKGVQGGC